MMAGSLEGREGNPQGAEQSWRSTTPNKLLRTPFHSTYETLRQEQL